MTEVACFCGCLYWFGGASGDCPRCGERAAVLTRSVGGHGRLQPGPPGTRLPATALASTGNAGAMTLPDGPRVAGIHHLKLPVTDLARSREWYESRLGYRVQVEFVEQGQLMGYVLEHPDGGPVLALRLSPERARAAGFDYFAIGVKARKRSTGSRPG